VDIEATSMADTYEAPAHRRRRCPVAGGERARAAVPERSPAAGGQPRSRPCTSAA